MNTLRASSAPLILKCAQSLRVPPTVDIREQCEAADTGTLVHRALCRFIETGQRTELSDKDARIQFASGLSMWRGELAEYFPDPRCEQEIDYDFGPVKLTGHADVVSIYETPEGLEARVLDFKTGRRDDDYSDQLTVYAVIIRRMFGAARVRICTAWTRTKEADWGDRPDGFGADELLIEEDRIARALIEADPPYSPGEHCRFCPRWRDCEARRQIVRQTIADLAAVNVPTVRDIEPGQFRRLWAGKALLQDAINRLDAAVRQDIQMFGPLPLGDGTELCIKEETQTRIETQAALGWLLEAYGPAAVDARVKLTKTDVDDMAREKARAEGARIGEAQKAAIAALKRIGATREQVVRKLQVRKQGKEIQDGKL